MITNIDTDNPRIYMKTADGFFTEPDNFTESHPHYEPTIGELCLNRTKTFAQVKYVVISSKEQQEAFDFIRDMWMAGVNCDRP